MGKNQHSKDGLHVRPTEWAQDGSGFKATKRSPFARLPLDCCFLSFQPFASPVCTREGAVFETKFIVKYIKRFGKNPVTGGKLEISQLVPLQFHSNVEGKLHCPVTFKVFTNHSHVAVNLESGHVYSFEALDTLNRKQKNWSDLITSKKFKWTDVVSLQDPDDCTHREVAKFWFMQQGQQDEVTKEITNPESKITAEMKGDNIRKSAALDRIADAKRDIAEEKAREAAESAAQSDPKQLEDEKKGPVPLEELVPRKTNERFTSGEVAESFTSTSIPLRTQNELRALSNEESLLELYEVVRKKKLKGYVRVITSEGMLNIELATDIVPRTTDNFLRLCERDYYNDCVFHRLIKNFMIQGGDPTGTGKGGQSAFRGGQPIRDEFDSRLSHQGPGVVSMANSGKNTNKSQFFISLKSCQHLDLKHSVFGRVVGGLQLLSAFNGWETDDRDKPLKEIKILRTEIFKNPFRDMVEEMTKPVVEEKPVDPLAKWFSNRSDPMENHKARSSTAVGKYLDESATEKRKSDKEALPDNEMEYVTIAQKAKKPRVTFDFSKW